jgi:hypothetical protein
MNQLKPRVPDPQWDLTMEIVRALELTGSYEVGVDTGNAQRVVDIRWAARQAGRLLGIKTRVTLVDPKDVSARTGTASVTSVDGDLGERLCARQGLNALRNSVRKEQTRTLIRPAVPEPRRRLPAPVGASVMGQMT